MPDPQTPFSTPAAVVNERLLLFILAAVQFTHIVDFMIIMPLGKQLMAIFSLSALQFSILTAAYSIAAAIVGFLAGCIMDRIPRRSALLVLYAGFSISTIGCALAPTYEWLMLARVMAGVCGGVASSVVGAMVADVVPPGRRGRAMAVVATAFPLATVLGVPAALFFASLFSWHTPFFLLGIVSLIVFAIAVRALPSVPSVRTTVSPLKQMKAILTHPIHIRAFLLSGMLVFAGGMVIPFMAPSMEMNAGLSKDEILLMYICGGAVTIFTTNLFGRLTDRYDKLYVLAGVSVLAMATVVAITRIGTSPLWVVLALTSLFFVTMSGRFAPAMAMVANAVSPEYRGGFMSVNASMQQACGGLANMVAGAIVVRNITNEHLENYDKIGLISAGAFIATVALAAWLRAAAPHAARNKVSQDTGSQQKST